MSQYLEELNKFVSPHGPQPTVHYIDLPLTRLHYAKCGNGPPLIMVPATISRLHEWIALTQFFGSRYTVYFFELPGHGGSTAFEKPFTTQQVAQTVEAFIDALGYKEASILGFSFGGLLTMRTIYHLKDKVTSVILYAPSLTKKAIILPKYKIFISNLVLKLFRNSWVRLRMVNFFKTPKSVKFLSFLMFKFGKVDSGVNVLSVKEKLTDKTLEVLTYQLEEVLNLTWPLSKEKMKQPCYFGMSINDTMLDYEKTLDEVKKHFETVKVKEFTFPYHQPPKHPTLEELQSDFLGLLELTEV